MEKRKVPPGAERAKECNFHSTPCLTAKADLGPRGGGTSRAPLLPRASRAGDTAGDNQPARPVRQPRGARAPHLRAQPAGEAEPESGGRPPPPCPSRAAARSQAPPEAAPAPARRRLRGQQPCSEPPVRLWPPPCKVSPHLRGAPDRPDSGTLPAAAETGCSSGHPPAQPPLSATPAPPPAPCRSPGPPGTSPARTHTHRAGRPGCRGTRGARP